jgi:rubrerythrin
MIASGTTRRELVRRGALASGAALAGAALPALRSTPAFAKLPDDDVGIVSALLALEQQAAFVYAAAIASGKLGGDSQVAAKLFRRQEQEHADALASALEELGGTAPAPPASNDDVKGLSDALGSASDLLGLAIELETTAVATYNEAIQKLKDGKLLQTAASIVANEGQHLVVLRRAAGQDPLPDALETGADD